jgi:chromosome segregation ATPase
MWELVRVDMDQKRDDTERGMKEMWRDFETEGRDAYKNLDRELKERHETEIEGMRRELDESRDNLQQAFEAEREEVIQEIENMRDELYEERMAPIEEEITYLDEKIGLKFQSIEGLYQQQEELAGQLEGLEAQVRKLDQKAEFGLLSVIGGAINNAEKLEQNPASMAGAPGVSLADFLPAPPSRGE